MIFSAGQHDKERQEAVQQHPEPEGSRGGAPCDPHFVCGDHIDEVVGGLVLVRLLRGKPGRH